MAGTLVAATLESGTASTAPTFTANGTQIGTLCRAWCKFNGTTTGTNAPTAGFNVSSVTRNSTSNYTVTYTNVLGVSNYTVVATADTAASGTLCQISSQASGSVTLLAGTVSGPAASDRTAVYVAVFS